MAPVQHTPGETFVFTRAGVRALDRAAAHDLGIPGIVLMENAAIALRQAALEIVASRSLRDVVVCCGPGNNGGDGLALARHLHNQGVEVRGVLAADTSALRGDALVNLHIARRMGVTLEPWTPGLTVARPSDTLLVDGLLGTGLDRPAEGTIAECVMWINAHHDAGAFVLSIDIPTGLDADTGRPIGTFCIRADRTVTLAGMKSGLTGGGASEWCGEVLVGDIGVPTALLRRFALQPGRG